MAAITIRPAVRRKDLADFVKFPWRIYAHDQNWVPPIVNAQLDRLDPLKNPFFDHADMQCFIAERGGEPVGTISATINKRRNACLDCLDAYFGFFECIDDVGVAHALIETAMQWGRDHHMTRLRGPVNLDEAEEVGVLVDGFDTRPPLLLGHSPPYYATLLEKLGLEPWYETSAWRLSRGDLGGKMTGLPNQLFVAAERAGSSNGVSMRSVDLRRWDDDVGLLLEMWNQTIAPVNESFVPIEEATLRHMVKDLKPLVDPDLALLAEVPDDTRESGTRPIGFAVALPDLNQILRKIDGSLYPLGWAKLLANRRRINALTFKLLGVSEEYRLRGVAAMLMVKVIEAAWRKGYETCDMSVIDAGNSETQKLLEALGAYPYRTYRLYERPL